MIDNFVYFANMIGVIAFSASGALKGLKHNLDILGIIVLSIITAVGGGIIRDIIVNRMPSVFLNPQDIYISIIIAILIFVIAKRMDLEKQFIKQILVMDAIGLAIFTIIGAKVGNSYELSMVSVAILSTITGVGGGVIRDLLVGEIPIVLKEDVYAILCFIGALLYTYLYRHLDNVWQPYIIVFLFIVVIRFIAIKYKLNLPK